MNKMEKKSIFLDIGHGGVDDGASYGFVDEDDINLAVTFYLDYELRLEGVKTFLSREKDEYISLEQRSIEANIKNVDLFVSIHCDAFHKETSSGMSVHIYQNPSVNGIRAATLIEKQLLIQFPQHKHRGIKKSNFYVLRKTKMPAVLIECEFLSNPETRDFLKEPENQRRLARTIKTGIMKYLET